MTIDFALLKLKFISVFLNVSENLFFYIYLMFNLIPLKKQDL